MALTATSIIEDKKDRALQGSPITEVSIEKTGLKVGLITCASLIIYFMVMNYFNFMNSAIAWGFNFIILWSGINFAYRYYRSKTKLNVEYFPGLLLGGITTAVSVVPYVIFVFIYFSQAGDSVLLLLKSNNLFMGEQITPVKAAASTMIEGICSGVIITFMMMQYFKSGFRRSGEEKNISG